MFGAAARVVAKPAVAAAASAVAASAAQGTAQARAPPQQGAARTAPYPHGGASSKVVDRDEEWLLAELQDEKVLFQPYNAKELDEAASTVVALWSGQGYPQASRSAHAVPTVTEPDDDESSGVHTPLVYCAEDHDDAASHSSRGSDDRIANDVIEGANPAFAASSASGSESSVPARQQQELNSLMAITTRMLRRPGMQREVVKCMLEDEEVRALMLLQCSDLDRYLLAAGVTNPMLLPGPEEVGGPGVYVEQAEHEGPNLISKLVGAVAGALERAGDALAFLGGWLRKRLSFLFPNGEQEQQGEDGQQRTADQVLGGVMVLAVAVFCMAVIRRPLILRALRR